MKRFHVHVAVDDLAQSTRFYSALFGAQPTVEKPDYAKWMLDDPRINFAISHRGSKQGINHLGFQVDTDEELTDLQAQHEAAELAVFNEGNTQCCYAKSKKHWVTDPQGIAWEMYHSMGEVKTYHGDDEAASAGACCAPETSATAAPAANDAATPQTLAKQSAAVPAATAKCSTACCPAPAVA
jgi:catechol 2,3-dioxygenase-like lactoylglutathione lyase family enzyme